MRFKKGDVVNWKGSWGTKPARQAVVIDLELKGKNGQDVYDLNNGHWAYAYQLELVKRLPEDCSVVFRLNGEVAYRRGTGPARVFDSASDMWAHVEMQEA